MWARVPAGGLDSQVAPNTKEKSEGPPFQRLEVQNNKFWVSQSSRRKETHCLHRGSYFLSGLRNTQQCLTILLPFRFYSLAFDLLDVPQCQPVMSMGWSIATLCQVKRGLLLRLINKANLTDCLPHYLQLTPFHSIQKRTGEGRGKEKRVKEKRRKRLA